MSSLILLIFLIIILLNTLWSSSTSLSLESACGVAVFWKSCVALFFSCVCPLEFAHLRPHYYLEVLISSSLSLHLNVEAELYSTRVRVQFLTRLGVKLRRQITTHMLKALGLNPSTIQIEQK
jgi:hypothetical protein